MVEGCGDGFFEGLALGRGVVGVVGGDPDDGRVAPGPPDPDEANPDEADPDEPEPIPDGGVLTGTGADTGEVGDATGTVTVPETAAVPAVLAVHLAGPGATWVKTMAVLVAVSGIRRTSGAAFPCGSRWICTIRGTSVLVTTNRTRPGPGRAWTVTRTAPRGEPGDVGRTVRVGSAVGLAVGLAGGRAAPASACDHRASSPVPAAPTARTTNAIGTSFADRARLRLRALLVFTEGLSVGGVSW